MFGDERGDVDAESLLQIVLVLVVVWIALEIVGEILDIATATVGAVRPFLGVIVVALIVLWLLDRI
jgi:Ca2+/H+ antiporter